MSGITAVVTYSPDTTFDITLSALRKEPLIRQVIVIHNAEITGKLTGCDTFVAGSIFSGKTLRAVFSLATEDILIIIQKSYGIRFFPHSLPRFVDVAGSTGAALIYSDYYEQHDDQKRACLINDYQLGSVRDDFDFGPLLVFFLPTARVLLRKHVLSETSQHAALYELRLKVSITHAPLHLQEFLYTAQRPARSETADRLFDYVDPSNRAVQKEREAVFTAYLKSIGAYLKPRLRKAAFSSGVFPVEASIVIPVRNRRETIREAMESALAQQTDFPFNVIVVDNHSSDGTTDIVAGMSKRYPAVVNVIPERLDLGIGGCWNEAIYSDDCGRYAVQLDSDDLYSDINILKRVVDFLRNGRYAMVVGSYTLIDSHRNIIPPGLVDHKEWTQSNGHNNLLRVNGIGAPRAYDTKILRNIGFPNVSYGEDYAVSLRISREWRIGRIYDSLYLCRRWGDNTDASLPAEQINRNNAFKDKLRTLEILARKTLNKRPTR
jgi:GT2 family glycosyltransferase